MNENENKPVGAQSHEELLSRIFEDWREEFRTILESHRREIQDRLEKIEREIEKKSDKEFVDVVVRGIRETLHRHANEITCLHGRVGLKMDSETMWKIISLTLTLGGCVGGLIGFLIHLVLRMHS